MKIEQVITDYIKTISDHPMAAGTFTRSTTGSEVIGPLEFRPGLVFLFTADSTPTNRNQSVGIDDGFTIGSILTGVCSPDIGWWAIG